MNNFEDIEHLFVKELSSAKYVNDIPWLFSNPKQAFIDLVVSTGNLGWTNILMMEVAYTF